MYFSYGCIVCLTDGWLERGLSASLWSGIVHLRYTRLFGPPGLFGIPPTTNTSEDEGGFLIMGHGYVRYMYLTSIPKYIHTYIITYISFLLGFSVCLFVALSVCTAHGGLPTDEWDITGMR